jgi:hypothetical protein
MEDQIIAIHALVMIYLSLYGFFTQKSVWDYVYLFIFYVIVLHWTFQKGECYITLRYKQRVDPTYRPGDDQGNEMNWTFPDYAAHLKVFEYLQNILFTLSLYVVYTRNHISPKVYLPFFLLVILYTSRHTFFADCYSQPECILFEKIIQYCLILYGIYMLWLWT